MTKYFDTLETRSADERACAVAEGGAERLEAQCLLLPDGLVMEELIAQTLLHRGCVHDVPHRGADNDGAELIREGLHAGCAGR